MDCESVSQTASRSDSPFDADEIALYSENLIRSWLNNYCSPRTINNAVTHTTTENCVRVQTKLWTESNEYTIIVYFDRSLWSDYEDGQLSIAVCSRKDRPGETRPHFSTFHAGKFTRKAWNKCLSFILKNELQDVRSDEWKKETQDTEVLRKLMSEMIFTTHTRREKMIEEIAGQNKMIEEILDRERKAITSLLCHEKAKDEDTSPEALQRAIDEVLSTDKRISELNMKDLLPIGETETVLLTKKPGKSGIKSMPSGPSQGSSILVGPKMEKVEESKIISQKHGGKKSRRQKRTKTN